MPRSAAAEPQAAPAPTCGARLKRGGTCTQRAGHRTDHPGQGRCWLHGGATPVKHGRYSTIRRPRITELLAEHTALDGPLDTAPELQLMRALVHDYVERYDATMAALEAWHASWGARTELVTPEQARAVLRCLDEYEAQNDGRDGLTERQAADLATAREATARLRDGDLEAAPPAKPKQLPDVADAVRLLAEVTKAVERIEKARQASAVSLPELERLVYEMGRVLAAHVDDPDVVARVRAGWLALRVLGARA